MRYSFLKFIVLGCLLLSGGIVRAQSTIEIGLNSTTHIIFTSDLVYVDISSPDKILAKVVDASKNMLAIKASQEFAFKTTISALEANGSMHTFYVEFNPSPLNLVIDTRVQSTVGGSQVVNTQIRPESEQQVQQQPAATEQPAENASKKNGKRNGRSKKEAKPAASAPVSGITVTGSQTSNFGRSNAPTIEEVMRKGQQIYHITDKSYRLEASVVNVFAYSDLTYIVISIENKSDIGFESGDAQFTIESRRTSGKLLATDKSVWPKSSYGTLSCAPNSKSLMGYTIPKLTLQKNEMFKIYIYEKGGTRNLFLTLVDKDVNYAVSPLD